MFTFWAARSKLCPSRAMDLWTQHATDSMRVFKTVGLSAYHRPLELLGVRPHGGKSIWMSLPMWLKSTTLQSQSFAYWIADGQIKDSVFACESHCYYHYSFRCFELIYMMPEAFRKNHLQVFFSRVHMKRAIGNSLEKSPGFVIRPFLSCLHTRK